MNLQGSSNRTSREDPPFASNNLPNEVQNEIQDGDHVSDTDRRIQLKADKELIERLALNNFAGTDYENFATELVAYGIAVIQSWIKGRSIYAHCEKLKRPAFPTISEVELLSRSAQERDCLTQDTVSSAIEYFHRRALVDGKWDPDEGATLRTYFIGACVFSFSSEFKKWSKERKRLQEELELGSQMLEQRPGISPESSDPANIVSSKDPEPSILDSLSGELLYIAILVRDGYTYDEIGKELKISPRAVEGKMYRLRTKLRRKL